MINPLSVKQQVQGNKKTTQKLGISCDFPQQERLP